jgi:hypothetical protein
MEVILRQHVDNLGRRGDLVKVADGYARNYLLPRKMALLATEGNKKVIEREKEKFDAQEAEEQKVAQAVADRLANVEIEIARRVGETDALFGSVTIAGGQRLRYRSPEGAAARADQEARRVQSAGEAPSRRGRHAQRESGRGGRTEKLEVRSEKLEVRSESTEVETRGWAIARLEFSVFDGCDFSL